MGKRSTRWYCRTAHLRIDTPSHPHAGVAKDSSVYDSSRLTLPPAVTGTPSNYSPVFKCPSAEDGRCYSPSQRPSINNSSPTSRQPSFGRRRSRFCVSCNSVSPEMDEPGWSWPAWKFGMKRSDLFTKLHDQYNTTSTPIQDKVAFHHDVYEISNRAACKDDFHRLMVERKEQRLDELNNGLELASVKIISNPNLIRSDQWALAIQLFRERSLDALVRYFASYLPESQWESDAETISDESVQSDTTSRSSTNSVSTASTDVHPDAIPTNNLFTENAITHEPLSIKTTQPGPLSPPASEDDADSMATSPTDVESQDGDEFPVASAPSLSSRSVSFSESESGRLPPYRRVPHTGKDEDDAETRNKAYIDTPSDLAGIEPACSDPGDHDIRDAFTQPCTHNTLEEAGSETPTPRPHTATTSSFVTAKLVAQIRRSPSPSPSTRTRLTQHEARRSPRMRKRELSPQVSRTPCEMLCRIQKPLPEPLRCRPNGRRRVEVDC